MSGLFLRTPLTKCARGRRISSQIDIDPPNAPIIFRIEGEMSVNVSSAAQRTFRWHKVVGQTYYGNKICNSNNVSFELIVEIFE